MTGRVDQVNQELVTCQAISVNRTSCSDSKSKLTLGLLLDLSNIILVKGEVHRDGSGLDGDTTINLVLTILFVSILPFFSFRTDYYLPSVGESHLTSLGGSNDTGLRDKGVGKSGLSMVDVRNDGHVSDVGGLVCSAFSLVTIVQSCDDDFSRFLKLFRSLFTQANGKLLTHKRTDLVDGEARIC